MVTKVRILGFEVAAYTPGLRYALLLTLQTQYGNERENLKHLLLVQPSAANL